MRVGFSASWEQRKAIRLQQARLSRPEPLLEIVRSSLPPGFTPASVTGSMQSAHPDRFVTRVDVRSAAGEESVFAVKAYADDFGKRVWTVAQMLVQNGGPSELHLPSAYIPRERALVFPWRRWDAGKRLLPQLRHRPQRLDAVHLGGRRTGCKRNGRRKQQTGGFEFESHMSSCRSAHKGIVRRRASAAFCEPPLEIAAAVSGRLRCLFKSAGTGARRHFGCSRLNIFFSSPTSGPCRNFAARARSTRVCRSTARSAAERPSSP